MENKHSLYLTLVFLLLAYSTTANKGMTFQATIWPQAQNNWTGQMGCNGCDPYQGDTDCQKELPILCVLHHKTIDRPFYDFPTLTNWAISDGGFYNGWTGGVYVVTKPVKGIYIDDYATGNKYCVAEYGPNAKFSEFHDGKYMSFMNDPPAKVWITWDWSQTLSGGWAHWGYFNHQWKGRAWTWINDQPNGNCKK